MKIYLDNCCYNRPYDNQEQFRISIEAQAKMYIQRLIRDGKVDLVSSYVLMYEISRNPHISTRANILSFVDRYSSLYVGAAKMEQIGIMAKEIEKTGVKTLDSLHIACAIDAGADWFLTTDDRILKYGNVRIRIANPIDFIKEAEVL